MSDAPWILLGLLVTVTIATITIVSVSTTYYCDDPESLKAVSDFYGPGAFFAWCITAISTLVTTDLRPAEGPERPSTGRQSRANGGLITRDDSPSGVHASDTHEHASEYDPGLLTTIGYPIIASGDVFRTLIADANPSQRRAALTVTEVAQSICLMGMAASLWLGPKPRHFRFCAWASGLLACSLAMGAGIARELVCRVKREPNGPLMTSALAITQGFLIPFGSGLWATNSLSKTALAVGESWWNITLAIILMPVWIIIYIICLWLGGRGESWTSCEPHLRLAVPRSGVDISGLSQAAALGAAIVCSAAIPALLRVHAHLHDHAQDEGIASYATYVGRRFREGVSGIYGRLSGFLSRWSN